LTIFIMRRRRENLCDDASGSSLYNGFADRVYGKADGQEKEAGYQLIPGEEAAEEKNPEKTETEMTGEKREYQDIRLAGQEASGWMNNRCIWKSQENRLAGLCS